MTWTYVIVTAVIAAVAWIFGWSMAVLVDINIPQALIDAGGQGIGYDQPGHPHPRTAVQPPFVPTTIRDMEAYVDFCESVWITTPYDDIRRSSRSGKCLCGGIPLMGGLDKSLQVMAFGLSGETGEVMEWIKKYVRDGSDDRSLLLKEFGDVQYYLYMLARRFGFSVNDVVAANVEKLKGRVDRGTQRGSGDLR
jgi:NTP pyrophosphatase (non-canonical NTP hydrolase)